MKINFEAVGFVLITILLMAALSLKNMGLVWLSLLLAFICGIYFGNKEVNDANDERKKANKKRRKA